MDAGNFDRITRSLARGITRRGVFALAGALAASRGGSVLAVQLGPPSCGQAGAVCTMLSGCCEGFTCITSSINVNYGVCAPGGSGGTVAAMTSLISPFSDGVVDEVSSATANQESTTTTDVEAEREAALAERKARKQAHKSRIKARKDDQRDRRRDDQKDQRERRRLRGGPKLNIDLFLPTSDDEPERLTITNRGNLSAVLTKIALASKDTEGTSLNQTLSSGQSFHLLSGIPVDSETKTNEMVWRNKDVCVDSSEAFVLSAAFSSELDNQKYVVSCDGSFVDPTGGAAGRRNNKRGRKRGRRRRKNRDKK